MSTPAGDLSARVTVIGSALIDDVHGHAGVRRYLGGTGFNLSAALAQEAVPAALVASIGSDDEGRALKSALASLGVILLAQPTLPATRHAATQLSDGEPRYRFGEETRRQVSLTPEVVGAVRSSAAVVVNSFPFDSTDDVSRLAAVFDSTPALRIVDPNPRPDLVRNSRLFGRNLDLLLASTDIVKISQADLILLDQDLDEILARGVRLAFLTKGADGADIVMADRTVYSVPARTVAPLADTIGAGDAALAGLIAAILRAEDGLDSAAADARRRGLAALDWPAHLARAMDAAAACCGEPGGPGHTLFHPGDGVPRRRDRQSGGERSARPAQ